MLMSAVTLAQVTDLKSRRPGKVFLLLLGMPSALPSAKLSSVVPTNEEVERAKEIMKSLGEKEMASRMASMRHFVRLNPDAAKLKHQERLERFIVHQFRSKDANRTQTSEKQQSSP